MNNWKDVKFDDLVRLKRGYDLPSQNIIDGKYPIVSSSNIKAYHNQFKVKPPGVVTGRSGTLGVVQYVNEEFWPLNTALYAKEFRGNFPKYVYYYLSEMKLENFNAGAGVPTLNQNHLQKLPIKIPSLEIQKKIAAILSAYDDLIENNKRRIALLENMAEEIYREWFVRFRFTGYQTTEFEKGIPKGWVSTPIKEMFDYLEGPGIRNWQYAESGFPFINIRLIQNGDINTSSANFINENEAQGKYAHFQLVEDDYVVSTSGTLGRGAIVQGSHLPLLLNTSVIRFREKITDTKAFMFCYLNSELFVKQIETFATGSAQQNFGPMHLSLMKIIKPSDSVLSYFNKICLPIFQEISILRNKIKNLEGTKDMLLPRLISGKLSVEDLDIQFPASMQEDNVA